MWIFLIIAGLLIIAVLFVVGYDFISGGANIVYKIYRSIRYIIYSVISLYGIDTPLKREKAEIKRKQEESRIQQEKEERNAYLEQKKKKKDLFYEENKEFFEMDVDNLVFDKNISLEDLMRENIILKKMVRHLFRQDAEIYKKIEMEMYFMSSELSSVRSSVKYNYYK